MFFRSSLRAKRSNPLIFGLPRRAIALLAMTFIIGFMNISEVHAQEKGLLAHVLAESCDLYVDQKNEKGLEYKVFCSGYFEALIEQKQHHGDKDIYKCLPTYGDFDPFKIRVIEGFLKKYEVKRYQGDTYVRAFNLANDAIDEQYLLECKR